jgi:hypothetical protein
MTEIPELPHAHSHCQRVAEVPVEVERRKPIAPGTAISLIELCGKDDPDMLGGFVQHFEQTGPADFDDGKGKRWHEDNHVSDCIKPVDTLAEAHGIWFDCPLCWCKNGGKVGTHGVLVWFAGKPVPDRLGKNNAGATVRWNVVGGTGLSDLQLAPSILLQGGCGWHGFVGSSGVPPGFSR